MARKKVVRRVTMGAPLRMTNLEEAVEFWTLELLIAIVEQLRYDSHGNTVRSVIQRIILQHTKLGFDTGVQSMRATKKG